MPSLGWLATKEERVDIEGGEVVGGGVMVRGNSVDLERLGRTRAIIPPLDFFFSFNFFLLAAIVILSIQLYLIITANISMTFFSFAKFCFDWIRQATASFLHSMISITRQSSLAFSTRSWCSSKAFYSNLDPTL